jgi:MerR family mercuric resistance operon transcriptional regulator
MPSVMAMRTIGKLAREAGVNVETVRFYQRAGLIQTPPRLGSYRCYPDEAVRRLRFIRRAKALGFSLKEIQELLHLSNNPMVSCAEVKERAEAKLTAIDAKIRDLRKVRGGLQTLLTLCSENDPARGCPILDALAPEGDA